MLYKITLKQKTESIGEIKASTLFGAFVTAYSNYTDIDKDIIDDIVLTDLFIKGQLPIGIKNNNTVYNKVSKSKVSTVTRTLIARDQNSKNIINVKEAYYNEQCEFYLSTDLLDKKDIKNIVETMLLLGLGKWRNLGKGQFELIDIQDYEPDTTKTAFVALSNFIPTDNDLKNIIDTGYEIRKAIAANGLRQTSKTLLKTGTVFSTYKDIVGKHVYDEQSKTYIHGKSIVLGV